MWVTSKSEKEQFQMKLIQGNRKGNLSIPHCFHTFQPWGVSVIIIIQVQGTIGLTIKNFIFATVYFNENINNIHT